jgi:hypothetical protein
MRRWSFVLIWLLTISLAACRGRGDSARVPEPPASGTNWPSELSGAGLTEQHAKKDAVKHVIEEMTKYLAQQNPPIETWRPTADYVKRYVIQGNGKGGEDVPVKDVALAKTWIYPLKSLDLAQLRALDQEAQRMQRRQERVILGTQLFGGFALALAVLTVYFKVRGGWARRGSANRG